uniref:Uncharacterized protein n=1 Tax=Oryza sativa subsp. japonica TaxID=39947 RepID=Q6YXA6_ORYSJ|nr:hypothetical protein [Oryza sativa Japonica Group]
MPTPEREGVSLSSAFRPNLASTACSRHAAASSTADTTALQPTYRPRAAVHLPAPARCP